MRAEALTTDHDYDEATRDYRAALDAAQRTSDGELINSLNHAYHTAKQAETNWAEHRDHSIVLQLPVNIAELDPKRRCMWIKKQYKAMAKKWHPDKARGDKNRASRKMSEVGDAKRALVEQYGCRGIR